MPLDGDAVDVLHEQEDLGHLHEHLARLDRAADVADDRVADLLRDLALGEGLVDEALVLRALALHVLERPDLLGLGVLDQVDDRCGAAPDLGEDAEAGEAGPGFDGLVVLQGAESRVRRAVASAAGRRPPGPGGSTGGWATRDRKSRSRQDDMPECPLNGSPASRRRNRAVSQPAAPDCNAPGPARTASDGSVNPNGDLTGSRQRRGRGASVQPGSSRRARKPASGKSRPGLAVAATSRCRRTCSSSIVSSPWRTRTRRTRLASCAGVKGPRSPSPTRQMPMARRL